MFVAVSQSGCLIKLITIKKRKFAKASDIIIQRTPIAKQNCSTASNSEVRF